MSSSIIIGAGLSGLAVAERLRRRDPAHTITVLEARSHIGGNIGTEYHDGFRVETGPNGFLDNNPTTLQLCRDLGLGDRLIAASEGSRKNRYVYLNGRMQRLPGSLWSFVRSPLLTIGGKIAFARERYRRTPAPDGDESIRDFAIRRAGVQAADIFADALVTGIQGGDPALLSVRACFPRLVKLEREHGSVIRGVFRSAKQKRLDAQARGEPRPGPVRMWSFREGLQVMIDALQQRLNDCIQTNVRIDRVERVETGWRVWAGERSWQADSLVLTTPAYEQARCLQSLDPQLATMLDAIVYNRIAVVVMGFRASDAPGGLDGFGYIAPQRTRRDVLGVQWCSSIFPDRAPPGMVIWRALCGGWHRGEMVEWDDDRLRQAVVAEMRTVQGVKGEPVFTRIVRWPRAIPQYLLGHLDRVRAIEERVGQHPRLWLGGNAFHGVAMNDCVEQGNRIAASILN